MQKTLKTTPHQHRSGQSQNRLPASASGEMDHVENTSLPQRRSSRKPVPIHVRGRSISSPAMKSSPVRLRITKGITSRNNYAEVEK